MTAAGRRRPTRARRIWGSATASPTPSRTVASGRSPLVYFCGVVCFYAVNFWMPTIIQELGIDKKDFLKVGLLSMIPWGCAAVAMVLWGSHSDRTGERRWHSAGGLLVAIVGLILLALVGKAPVPSIVGSDAGDLRILLTGS